MRRFLFFLAVAAFGFGAFAVWWAAYWASPRRVVAGALENLVKMKSAGSVRAGLSWDLRHSSGQGFVFQKKLSYAGSLDLSDPTAPMGEGAVGYSVDPSGSAIQTADIVLSADRVYVRLGEHADEEMKMWFGEAEKSFGAKTSSTADSPEASWYSFARDPLLENAGFESWKAEGKASEIRSALAASDAGGWATAGPAKIATTGGRQVLRVYLKPNAEVIQTALADLVRAWRKRTPTGPDFDWAARSANAVAKGSWTAEIDIGTRTFRWIAGTWPLLGADGSTIGHANFLVDLAGIGARVGVRSPEPSIDLTEAIIEKTPSSFTPAGDRAMPSLPASSSEEGVPL
jgi:hypothetical protein